MGCGLSVYGPVPPAAVEDLIEEGGKILSQDDALVRPECDEGPERPQGLLWAALPAFGFW